MRAAAVVLVLLAGCFTKPDRPVAEHDAASGSDGASTMCDPTACQAAGGSCREDRCEILAQDRRIRCPGGMPCRVICIGKDACKEGVACAAATTCEVDCQGDSACQHGVDCGTSDRCDVRCVGPNACKLGVAETDPSVNCHAATCEVTCTGSASCEQGIEADGVCAAHCCDGACIGGTGTCSVDAVCS